MANSRIIPEDLVSRAIRSALKHHIRLVPGRPTSTIGNCCFEAVLFNINDRGCFDNLHLDADAYRQMWINEFQEEVDHNYPDSIPANLSPQLRLQQWNKLKHSGCWNVDLFGDMVPNAIARGCRKNLLIFNTSPAAASPIYVIQAETFGGVLEHS